jgi:polar amino acid transport system substrate-binding protein
MFKAHALFTMILLLFSKSVIADEFHFVSSTFCPFVCDPKVDAKEGFVVDILRDALASKNHTIDLTIVPYKRALNMVRSGKAHALPAIYKEDAPDLEVSQSVIAKGNNHFFVRPDSNWKYNALDNWQEMLIGVVDGYTFNHPKFDEYLAEQKKINSQVVFINGDKPYQRLFQLLITKKIDAILDDKAYMQYELHRANANFSADSSPPPIISAGALSKGQLVVAYSPKHPETTKLLMQIIDPFVVELYKTGKIDKYLRPYGVG